ncbi:MAG: hypothetical protein U9O18_02285 [Chloroflexota bacterium]|nr:hypothetical protein [Chloroflexota bacterium]
MNRVVLHLPLLAIIVAAMVVGIAAGLARLGIEMPSLATERIILHGPILAAGVFGTLIALERAVALRTVMGRNWTFADASPVLGAAGTILLVVNGATVPAVALLTAGAAVLVVINLEMLRRQSTLDVLTMTLGAVFLLLADVAWLADRPVPFLTPWWIAFLVLTITGERLELARLRIHGHFAHISFAIATAIYIGALLFMLVDEALGVRLSGIGMIALTIWLLHFDIARVTIKRPGLPRFVAACLLAGYVWLGSAGLIAVANEQIWGSFSYDAYLHASLLGFVFSMVFGHAPIIFPAILGRPINFHPIAWLPLVLLHVSVAARILGDVVASPELRQTGGILTATAIALYAVVVVIGLVRGPDTGSGRASSD